MKSPEPEVILKLAQDLKDAKNHLASLQARWDSYFTAPNVDLPFPKKGGRRPDAESVTGRILAKLAEDRTKNYSKEEIAEALGIDVKQAERTLIKQQASGKITRAERGRYSAKRLEIAA